MNTKFPTTRLTLGAFSGGLAVIAFLAGVYVTEYRIPPYFFIRDGYHAARAWKKRLSGHESKYETNFWQRTDRNSTGTVQRKPSSAYEGFTFYTSGAIQGANLIAMDGTTLHEWRAQFRKVWNDPSHVDHPVPSSNIYWRDAHLYPDGDVLALYIGHGDTPWGYGIAKLDSESNVEWTYDEHAHHVVQVSDAGGIYTLVHEVRDLRDRPLDGASQLRSTVLEDFVVQLDAEGRERHRFSLLEAVTNSKLNTWVRNSFHRGIWDLLHPNDVQPVGRDFAEHHSQIRPSDVLVSFRRPDVLAIFGSEHGELRWADRGTWISQHDPDPLPNGDILFFDNYGLHPTDEVGISRVVQLAFGPDDHASQWSFTGTESNPLQSSIRSMQQKLPNRNILITESNGGRLLEVTPDGKIPWEFHSGPIETADGHRYAPILSAGRRISPDSLDFELAHTPE